MGTHNHIRSLQMGTHDTLQARIESILGEVAWVLLIIMQTWRKRGKSNGMRSHMLSKYSPTS